VVFVMGDFFWRLPLLLGSISVVANSCLSLGCPSDLILKSGGPITFDSRSGVSSLVQVWFWALFGVLLVDRRFRGGGS